MYLFIMSQCKRSLWKRPPNPSHPNGRLTPILHRQHPPTTPLQHPNMHLPHQLHPAGKPSLTKRHHPRSPAHPTHLLTPARCSNTSPKILTMHLILLLTTLSLHSRLTSSHHLFTFYISHTFSPSSLNLPSSSQTRTSQQSHNPNPQTIYKPSNHLQPPNHQDVQTRNPPLYGPSHHRHPSFCSHHRRHNLLRARPRSLRPPKHRP